MLTSYYIYSSEHRVLGQTAASSAVGLSQETGTGPRTFLRGTYTFFYNI